MSNLTCPGCGSVYPLSSVSNLDQFPCAVCHHRIVVPMAGPSAARLAAQAPKAPPPPPPPAPPPLQVVQPVREAPAATQHHRRRRAPREPHARSGGRLNPGLIAMGVAVAAAAAMAVVMSSGSGDPASGAAKTGTTPASGRPPAAAPAAPAPPAVKADPMKDVAAWKALAASDRAARTTNYITALDARNGDQLSAAFTFFKLRGEDDAVQRVAALEIARDPSSGWARKARGDEIVDGIVDRCLAECVRAEEADTPAIRKLAALRKAGRPAQGVWWMDAAAKKELESLCAEIRLDQSRLQDPYEWALSKWDVYQRRIEVMRDFPSISSAAGPYIVFAQLKAPAGTPLERVDSTEMARARRVLDQEKTLFAALYEGFFETFGAPLGLTRYDRTNLDEKSIQKVNVFPDEASWKRYHGRLGEVGWPDQVLAYYRRDEPRFLVTYDVTGADAELADYVRCREAAVQLLHFYSWDATRKEGFGELAWAQCRPLPLSMELGVGAFLGSHRRDGDRFVWMFPIDRYMERVWLFSQVLVKKRWAMWGLDELLAMEDWQEVDARATRRALPRPVATMTDEQRAEVATALRIYRPLYQAKAWSLVTYVWNAPGPGGKLLYRDRFLAFLRDGLRVKPDPARGAGGAVKKLGTAEFRAALGLATPSDFAQFERAWLAWESSTFAKSADATWAQHLDDWLRSIEAK